MRKIWDIHGGIHPAENKTQSNQEAITQAGIPAELIFPLSQHIGAPASPVVSVGQHILKGEKIAEAKGFVSVPVHASTSGEVIAIENHFIAHPSGMTAPCIIIRPDGKDQWIEHQGISDYTTIEKTELLNRIRDAGIAGMGGAGFPSAVKLNLRDDQIIETLIINGTECEPYITSDDRLMRERAEEIIEGVKILQHLISPVKETLIGIEDNKPEAIAAMKAAAAGTTIDVVVFPTKYPSGGEKQLIQILTGKEVPSGGLPAQVGIVCQNIGTTYAVYRAVQYGEPLISRITTVTGSACERQSNFEVLLGTPIHYLLNLCGYQAERCSRLVMGGPMMGFSLESADVPVVKTTNCVLAPTPNELPPPAPVQACIRCGMCAEACPVSLLPQQMYWFARAKEYDKLEGHNLMDCIECGACSYACPSNIPLVQYYRASKAEIRQQKLDAEKAEHSKARFEARQARIERQEAEKEAKRAARKAAAEAKAAAGSDNQESKQDAVQAAIERAKAKRAGGATATPQSKTDLEKAVTAAEKRLATAREKLQQAEEQGADTVPAFKTGVEKSENKLAKVKAALDDFIANNPQASTPAASTTNDPAQLAIERAQQKRAGAATQSPLEKVEQQITSLKTRIDKAQAKLAEARAENSDKLEIFETSVQKLQEKLAEAEQQKQQLQTESPTSNKIETNDPAKQAADDIIARALAKREAASKMTDLERLQNAVNSIETRIAKTKEKLTVAEQEGSDTIDILTESVKKLEVKLVEAKQALSDYEDQQG